MRAVLDPNVLIAALLSSQGAPRRIFHAWLDGRFELIISAALLDELSRALAYPKLRRRISAEYADALIDLLTRSATVVADPPPSASGITSSDPGDDYLIDLALAEQAALVSGDRHLLTIQGDYPIYSPARFAELIDLG